MCVCVMINEVDEGMARTKINEFNITGLANRQPRAACTLRRDRDKVIKLHASLL